MSVDEREQAGGDGPQPVWRGDRPPPVVTLAMSPLLFDGLFAGADRAHLEQIARVDTTRILSAAEPVSRWPGLADTEVLVSCWGAPRLDADLLAGMPALRAVVHAAGSVKDIVTDECRDRGITVSSAAEANAVPVAEYTVAMIVLAGKQVLDLSRRYGELRTGWRGDQVPATVGNYRKVVGIVGASRIGRRVIELLRSFDVTVLLSDPYVDAAQAAGLGAELVDLDELCARSDVVSLHAPSLPSTRHMIDGRRLALLSDGSTLINTARGALVDTEALVAEVRTGRISAVLDHTEPAILPARSPLYDLPNVLLTPHIAGSLGTELHRMGHSALEELDRYIAGAPFAHPVLYEDLERSA